MRRIQRSALISAFAVILAGTGQAQFTELNPAPATPLRPGASSAPGNIVSPQYILRQGDVVQVKVYQEDDLTSICRIGKDGAIAMPLLGSVKVVSNSLEQATITIRDLLNKDYVVNPQVTLSVIEFAKRRFTVLGQVQRPGTYDMPADESVSLLQAIATAGGYTRIANAHKITVQRTLGSGNKLFRLDAEATALKTDGKPFEILPDDVIVVGERWL